MVLVYIIKDKRLILFVDFNSGMNLDIYIGELLFQHDKVLVPGLGGFISTYVPAEVHADSQSFVPPSKKISFLAEWLEDDNLLVAYVAAKMNRPEKVAREMIAEQVGEVFNRVRKGEDVMLTGLGSLSFDKRKRLVFKASLETNFLMESFGLSSFTFPHLKAGKKSFFTQSAISRRRKKSAGKKLSILQTLILFFVLLLISLIPNNSRISESIIRYPAGIGQLPSLVNLKTPGELEAVQEEVVLSADTAIGLVSGYFIVAGSYQSLEYAEELRQKLMGKGYTAYVEQAEKMFFRVILAEYQTLDEVEQALPLQQDLNRELELWILK